MHPNPPDSAPTLAEVAAEAGVSRMTVSRVLRNSPKVLPETAARVREAIAKVGYRPDAEINRLMSYLGRHQARRGYRPTIAFIDTLGRPGVSSAPLTLASARERAHELGYQIEEFWVGPDYLSPARLATILITRNIQAVIVPPVPTGAQDGLLPWSRLAAVTIGFSLTSPVLDRVDQNHYHAALLALRRLEALGYRRIGMVETTFTERFLENNYLAGLLVYQHALPSRRKVPSLLVNELVKEDFLSWLKRHKPDAVLGLDPRLPEWIRASGRRIPQDMGYARLFVKPGETERSGVLLNAAGIGRSAVDLVVGKLHRNEFGLPGEPRVTLVEGTWNPGSTTRQQAPAPLKRKSARRS